MNNTIQNQYNPDYVSSPGETLEEALEEREMTSAYLAEKIGVSEKTINEIIQGKAAISPEMAKQLENVLGISASFWNNREKSYQEFLESKSLKKFPIPAMINQGWLNKYSNKIQQLRELLNFFGVNSLSEWEEISQQNLRGSFTKTTSYESEAPALTAWLRKGEIEAAKINCAVYNQEKFQSILEEIRTLTIESPEIFQKEIVQKCAQAGVAVVFIPQLPKARVSGATRWLNSQQPLIQLSLRYKTDDQLWFSFFHEAAHILLHKEQDIFLERSETLESDKEAEANQFATDFLIPPDEFKRFLAEAKISQKNIIDLANSLGISPGIIVGRLQKEKIIDYKYFNNLKRKLKWNNKSFEIMSNQEKFFTQMKIAQAIMEEDYQVLNKLAQ